MNTNYQLNQEITGEIKNTFDSSWKKIGKEKRYLYNLEDFNKTQKTIDNSGMSPKDLFDFACVSIETQFFYLSTTLNFNNSENFSIEENLEYYNYKLLIIDFMDKNISKLFYNKEIYTHMIDSIKYNKESVFSKDITFFKYHDKKNIYNNNLMSDLFNMFKSFTFMDELLSSYISKLKNI